jgi:putative salt-induced outer membrane protein YdiY
MKIAAILITAAISTVALADDNSNTNSSAAPAPAAAPVVKYPWLSSVSLGVTITRGNSDTTLLTGDFLTQKKTPVNEYSIGAGGAYGDQNDQTTVNNYKAFSQWNHLFTDRFYSYVRVEGLRDVIADVDYRLSIGPGAGYYLIKQTNTTLSVEGGAAYEAQQLDGEGSQSFCTLRLAEKYEYKFSAGPRFWESLDVEPQVDKFDNYVANAEIGVEAALTKSFSLKTYIDDAYLNQPAPGKLKNDAKLIAALAYKF